MPYYQTNVKIDDCHWPQNDMRIYAATIYYPSEYPYDGVPPVIANSTQYDSCSVDAADSFKDGNPCVAATGNKEYRVSDFEWEGNGFERTYNSLRQLSLLSGLGDNWAHSFSDRLILSAADLGWVGSDGYFDMFSKITDSTYASRNIPGRVIYRVTDPIEQSKGFWKLSVNGRKLWFNELGRLKFVETAKYSYTLKYCGGVELQSGACLFADTLVEVTSSTGRKLFFEYLDNSTSGAPAPTNISDTALISKIRLDESVLVEYQYDAKRRLESRHLPAPPGNVAQYLYAEPALLCRDGAGATIANCSDQEFPYLLTGVVDESANRLATYTYDDNGRVTGSEHAGGVGRVNLDYASSSVYVTLPSGLKKIYGLASARFRKPVSVSTQTSAGSNVCTAAFSYTDMRPASRVGCIGTQTTYGYDTYHENSRIEGLNAAGAITPETRTTETTWHPDFPVPIERRTYNAASSLVAKSTWIYNTRGQALTSSQTDPVTAAVRTTTTAYCEAGDVTAGTCPLLGLITSADGLRTDVSDLTTYTYYPSDDASCASSPTTCPHRKGDLWKVTDALGRVTETLAYDGAGRVLSVKNANGVVTDFTYHPRGWLTARKVRGPNNAVETDDQITAIEYWPTGLVKKVIQPDGAFTAYTYDAAHRLTDIADNAGNTIHYTLDNAGNRTAEETKDAGNTLRRTLSRVYNQLGQLQTAKDAYNHATGFTYDANGNNQTVTDALSRVTDNDYDPLNRLSRTLQDVGGIQAETKFEYDAVDNLTKVTDPKGLATTYQYNGLGDLTQLTSPDTGTTTYTYDSAGNRQTQTDARGVTSTYSYDALNRPTGIAYPTPSLNVGYSYDTTHPVCTADETFAIGRLTQMTDSSGDTKYCYDRFGNLTRKVQITNGQVFELRYAYTKAGQLQAITYPDGAIVDYVRDGQGRATEVGVTPAGGTRQILLHQATYHPFGPVAGWSYGNGRTMARPLNQNYQPTAVVDSATGGLSLGYAFDAVGNLSQLSNADQSTILAHYGYDALNRLTDVMDGPTNTVIEHYGYDATGNRTSLTNAGGTIGYTYPTGNHRLTQVGATARSYDNAGNTIQIGGTAKEFVYNDAGRMNQVKASGTPAMNYQLNGRGEQVRKYLGTSNTYTMYDEAGRWIGDYDTTGTAIQQAIWLDDLPVGLLASNQLKYLQPDHLGTPRVVIDPATDMAIWTWELKGEAFGNTVPNQDPDGNGTAFVLNMRFPGQRYDSASGLNQNGYRDYEAATGRYSQPDPIGLSGGINSYAYVDSNPLIFTDALGLAKDQTCVAAYTTAGAVCGGAAGYYGGGALGAVGGGFVCSPSGPGAAVCAVGGAAGGSTLGGATGSTIGGVLGNLAGQAICPDDDCTKLIGQINSLVSELKKRYSDLIIDTHGLPAIGPMSIAGHKQQFRNKQTRLRGLLNEAASKGCTGYNTDAWMWATMPTPR